MNKSIVFKVFVLITLLTGIAIPKLIYQDAENVPQKDIKVAKQEAHEVLEHPLDFLQIVNIVVREKTSSKIYLDAYTFFGLKYAVIEVVIDPKTGQWDSISRRCPSGLRAGLNPSCD